MSVCLSVCLSVSLSLASDSSDSIEVIIIKPGTSDMIMHYAGVNYLDLDLHLSHRGPRVYAHA